MFKKAAVKEADNPYYPADIGEPAGDGVDLRSIGLILWRRKVMVLATIALGVGMAGVVGFAKTPTYTAETLVLVKDRESRVVDVEQVIEGLGANNEVVETQINLLRSPEFVERLVARLGAARLAPPAPRSGELVPVVGALGFLERFAPKEWLIASGLAEARPELDEAGEAALLEARAISATSQRLAVSQRGRSLVVSIAYGSDDPREAALVANTLADIYIEDQIDQKLSATTKASSFLEERLGELQEQVRLADQAVETYRAENEILSTQSGTLSEQQLADLNRELIVTRARRSEKQASLSYIRRLISQGEGIESLSEVINSPLIVTLWQQQVALERSEVELRSSFGEKHPKILRIVAEKAQLEQKIESEINRVIRNLESEIAVLASREASIRSDMQAAKSGAAEVGQAAIRLRELERQAEANRTLYENFLTRFKETREQEQIVEADARIVARAKPPQAPSSLSPMIYLAIGFVASSAAGVGLAFLREQLDNGVRSGKQVEHRFGLPCLGLVPLLKRGALKAKQRPHEYLVDKPLSTYAETVRSVFTALRLSHVDAPLKVIQVTSSVPSEGKTTFAVSLAASLAQNGAHVCLLDLDLRHPSVQREIAMKGAGALSAYMIGEKSFEELIHFDATTGVDVIATEKTPANPPKLLGSARMKELMQILRDRYDFVVVDSTPVLGVSDSKAAMELADTVLFMVRWQETTFDTAGDAIKELQSVGAEIGGVVVTQVNVEKHAHYGYGGIDNYYSKYKQYYVN